MRLTEDEWINLIEDTPEANDDRCAICGRSLIDAAAITVTYTDVEQYRCTAQVCADDIPACEQRGKRWRSLWFPRYEEAFVRQRRLIEQRLRAGLSLGQGPLPRTIPW